MLGTCQILVSREMKGMKGRILKNLTSIPQLGYLKQGSVLQQNSSDVPLDPTPPLHNSNRILSDVSLRQDYHNLRLSNPPQPEIIISDRDQKENIRPAPSPEHPTPWKKKKKIEIPETRISEIDVSSFRRPDLNSATLFDPDLLAAFHQAVIDHLRSYEAARTTAWISNQENSNLDKDRPTKIPRNHDPLMEFEEKCPPGGRESVILYTTSLRGIRKTFEDCSSIRFLLKSSKVMFYERDISMHMEFREELWWVLGARATPPRLFIKGRYIGGADEVLGLHERGGLMPLVQGMPLGAGPCERCGGMSFILCFKCDGGRKIYDEEMEISIQCHHCNENGLIVCPICC